MKPIRKDGIVRGSFPPDELLTVTIVLEVRDIDRLAGRLERETVNVPHFEDDGHGQQLIRWE